MDRFFAFANPHPQSLTPFARPPTAVPACLESPSPFVHNGGAYRVGLSWLGLRLPGPLRKSRGAAVLFAESFPPQSIQRKPPLVKYSKGFVGLAILSCGVTWFASTHIAAQQ